MLRCRPDLWRFCFDMPRGRLHDVSTESEWRLLLTWICLLRCWLHCSFDCSSCRNAQSYAYTYTHAFIGFDAVQSASSTIDDYRDNDHCAATSTQLQREPEPEPFVDIFPVTY